MSDSKNLEIYEPEVGMVREIYRQYMAGESTSEIAEAVSWGDADAPSSERKP